LAQSSLDSYCAARIVLASLRRTAPGYA